MCYSDDESDHDKDYVDDGEDWEYNAGADSVNMIRYVIEEEYNDNDHDSLPPLCDSDDDTDDDDADEVPTNVPSKLPTDVPTNVPTKLPSNVPTYGDDDDDNPPPLYESDDESDDDDNDTTMPDAMEMYDAVDLKPGFLCQQVKYTMSLQFPQRTNDDDAAELTNVHDTMQRHVSDEFNSMPPLCLEEDDTTMDVYVMASKHTQSPLPVYMAVGDTGAEDHIIKDRALLYDVRQLDRRVNVVGVAGHRTTVTHHGSLHIMDGMDALLLNCSDPAAINLLSMGRIADAGCYFITDKYTMSVYRDVDDELILTGHREPPGFWAFDITRHARPHRSTT